MLSINIGPDDILKWFHTLSSGWQIMIALVVLPGAGMVAGWLLRRAWDARQMAIWRDLADGHEKKPIGASGDVVAPARNERRSVTQKEHRLMYEILRVIPAQEKIPITIDVRPDDNEAARYALEFQRLLASAGLDGGIANLDIPLDVIGLLIRIDNGRPQTPIAARLSEALTRAGLKHEIRALALRFPVPVGGCELVVGRCGPD